MHHNHFVVKNVIQTLNVQHLTTQLRKNRSQDQSVWTNNSKNTTNTQYDCGRVAIVVVAVFIVKRQDFFKLRTLQGYHLIFYCGIVGVACLKVVQFFIALQESTHQNAEHARINRIFYCHPIECILKWL